MAYRVVVLTRQDVNEGKLGIPEALGEAIARSAMQIARQVQAGALHHEHVEVLTLDPLHTKVPTFTSFPDAVEILPTQGEACEG